MLRAAITFFAFALIALLLGATGVAGISMDIAQTLIGVFLVISIISAAVHLITGRSPKLLP